MTLRRPADLDALAWGDGGLLPVVVQEVATGAVLMLGWADREAAARTVERREAWFWSRSRRSLWRKGETSGNTLAVAEVALDCDGDALLYRVDAAGPTCHTGARSCFEEAPAGEDLAPRVVEPAERLDEGSGGGRGGHREAGATSAGESSGGAARGGGDGEPVISSPGGASAGAAGGLERPITAASSTGPRLELGWLWDVLAERATADATESYTARLLAAGIDRIARKVGEEATEVVIAALRTAPPPAPAGSPHPAPFAGAVAAAPPAPGAAGCPGASGFSTPGVGDEASTPSRLASVAADAASADLPAPSRVADAPAGAPPAPPLAAEAADLLYHLLVLLLAAGVPPEEVAAELRRRHARPSTPPSPKPEAAPRRDPAGRAAAPPPEDRR